MGLDSPYSSSESSILVERTTISGNTADGSIGGLDAVSEDGGVTISQSEISGNSAGGNAGGGILQGNNSVNVVNSTISRNSAGAEGGGLGISVGGQLFPDESQTRGFISLLRIDFSTIVDNSSGNAAGGLLLKGSGDDAETLINTSAISGNTAPVNADLGLDEPDVAGESGPTANVTFSLIGVDPSTGTLNKDSLSVSLTGQNPQLGPLADNGGPTLTHLPLTGSPLIDQVPEGLGGCSSDAMIGDGSCDKEFNCEAFGWDGGDCSGP